MSHFERETLMWTIAAVFVTAVITLAAPSPTPVQIPTPIDISKIDFSKFKPEEIEATERHRDELKAQLKEKLESQSSVITTHGSTIGDIKTANDDTKKAFGDYVLVTETQIAKGNQAILALDHVIKKLHLAKWILCGIWLALCALVALKIPTVGMYVGGGLAVAGITFIWLWL